MAKKFSVLKPWRVKNLLFLFHFLITTLTIQDTVTYFDKDITKNLSVVQTPIVK